MLCSRSCTFSSNGADFGAELSTFISNLTFPVVVANLKTNHSGMNELKNLHPYTIIKKHNIGIIGLLTPDTKGTSSGGRQRTFQFARAGNVG